VESSLAAPVAPTVKAVTDGMAVVEVPWERRILARIAAGDESALGQLYDQYAGFVYALAHKVTQDRSTAEDIAQDVFVHVWTCADRFDPDRGSVRAWLGVITHRRAVDRVRRETTARAREERAERRRTGAPPDVAEVATSMVIGRRVRDALAALPGDQRQAIELAYFGGRTFREAAAMLGIPEGTAKSRIRLGMAKLTEALQGVAPWT
jgi:RNA polymerase sigma-70 factor (ECF subfamily)